MKHHDKIAVRMVALVLITALLTACSGDSGSVEESAETVSTETIRQDRETAAEPLPEETQTSRPSETTASGDIGIDAVRQIVLAKVPGAAAEDIHELEWEYDDGRLEYEGSIHYNGYEYEFEVDGATGNILQWEIDD